MSDTIDTAPVLVDTAPATDVQVVAKKVTKKNKAKRDDVKEYGPYIDRALRSNKILTNVAATTDVSAQANKLFSFFADATFDYVASNIETGSKNTVKKLHVDITGHQLFCDKDTSDKVFAYADKRLKKYDASVAKAVAKAAVDKADGTTADKKTNKRKAKEPEPEVEPVDEPVGDDDDDDAEVEGAEDDADDDGEDEAEDEVAPVPSKKQKKA